MGPGLYKWTINGIHIKCLGIWYTWNYITLLPEDNLGIWYTSWLCVSMGTYYVKVCRKVQLFGVCFDNNVHLIDESETIGHWKWLVATHYYSCWITFTFPTIAIQLTYSKNWNCYFIVSSVASFIVPLDMNVCVGFPLRNYCNAIFLIVYGMSYM